MKLTPARKATLARLYGLSEAEFVAIGEHQSWRCGMCDRPFSARLLPQVDHAHAEPFIVRGLLCARDNHEVLGRLHDSPDYYAKTAAYLRYPPAVTAIGQHRVPGAPPPPAGERTGAAAPEKVQLCLPGMEMTNPTT